MAISWKRLRNNPDYIYRVKREQVTDDVIDYVLSLPNIEIEFLKRFVKTFGNNNYLAQKVIEREDFDILVQYLPLHFDELPQETVQRILDKMDSNKTRLNLKIIEAKIIKKYPSLLKQYLRTEDADSIKTNTEYFGWYIDTKTCPKEEWQEIECNGWFTRDKAKSAKVFVRKKIVKDTDISQYLN